MEGDNVIEIPNIFLWVVAGMICFAVLYDTWASTQPNGRTSISELVTAWSFRWPALPFAVGFLCGHLFWRRR